jgi:hypothetical protein
LWDFHYAVRLIGDRFRPWREAAAIAILCGALAFTWFGWSMATYGVKTTVGSNTSVSFAQRSEGPAVVRIAGNIFDTIVPGWLRGQSQVWQQPNSDGLLRDSAFVFYQLNLIFAMGSIGGPLVVWMCYRAVRLRRRPRIAERRFWLAMIAFCVVAGIAVSGDRDYNGSPHLTLLALEIVGLAAIAGRFPRLPRAVRLLLVVGCAFDFYFGVFLQAKVESLENTPDRVVFADPVYDIGYLKVPSTYYSIGENSRNAWVLKHRVSLSRRWLAELPRGREADMIFQESWPRIRQPFLGEIADDAVNWQGWVARHGGSVDFLGDAVDGPSGHGTEKAVIVFLLLFAVLMYGMLREAAAPPRGQSPPRTVTSAKGAKRAAR